MSNNEEVIKEKIPESDVVEVIEKPEMTDELVKEFIPMIQSIAASVASGGKLPPGISFNDLVSFGYEGFVKSYKGFDGTKGAKFQTYAAYRVRGEMLDRIRKEWKYRNPVSYRSVQAKIKAKINEVVEESISKNENLSELEKDERKKRASDIVANSAVVYLLSLDNEEIRSQLKGCEDIAEELFEKIEFARERVILWEEVSDMTDLEKDFIHMFYEKEMTQKDIAEQLELSKSKASRMHVKILDKLRNRLSRRLTTKGE